MARFTFSALRLTLIAITLGVAARHVLAAPEHSGQVTFGGLPVPGATVTASAGDKQLVTATDEQGVFKLADVADGVWTIRVEMLGFATIERQVTIGSASAVSSSTSTTVSASPPTCDTIGIAPYRKAQSWVKPHGSKRDGTTRASAPA